MCFAPMPGVLVVARTASVVNRIPGVVSMNRLDDGARSARVEAAAGHLMLQWLLDCRGSRSRAIEEKGTNA